jgi:hypothetical protein
MITTRNLLSAIAIAATIIWFLTSFMALAAMYKLWWDRERTDYFFKSSNEQRVIVWRKAALPLELLETSYILTQSWPLDAVYYAQGDQTKLSYLIYLLSPRLPDRANNFGMYKVAVDGSYATANNVDNSSATDKKNSERIGTAWGSVAFFVILSGLTLALVFGLSGISVPEAAGCIVLGIMFFVVGSRALLQTSIPGFIIVTALSVCAWVYLVWFTLIRWARVSSICFGCGERSRGRNDGLLYYCKALCIAIICLSVLWAFLMAIIVVPDDWDAWAIWGAKAKVLALGTGPLSDVRYFGHGDYPLLWPSIWAYVGWLSGGWEEQWSRSVGILLYALCLWETVIIVRRLTGSLGLAWLCGALFASVPMVPLIASWSYAEAPLWLFILTTLGCLFQFQKTQNARYLVYGALLAAGAAYSKNEGVLIALVISVWLGASCDWKQWKFVFVFFIGWLFLYMPWFYWVRFHLGLASHATSNFAFSIDLFERAIQRTPDAIYDIVNMWVDVKQWNIVMVLILVTIVLTLYNTKLLKTLMIPLSIIFGYLLIVLFHSEDIHWQIGTAWNRLTVHVIPIFIIIFSVHVKTTFLNR